MSVVNCKVKFIRPQYNNLQEWCDDENNAYVGRAGIVFINNERYPKISSPFCNPFKIDKNNTREEVLIKYKNYLEELLENNDEMIEELLQLKGKNLGCWCHPESCHADILLKCINKYSE